MQKHLKTLSLLLCAALVFALCSCGSGRQETGGDGKLKVVCTLFPQYDAVRRIAGDKVDLTLLLTPGQDSHSYDPTPADIVKISQCDMFIYTGEVMEAWAENLLDGMDRENMTIIAVADQVELSAPEHDDDDEDGEEDHVHSFDPHVWASPVNALKISEGITEALCRADGENADLYRSNFKEYEQELTDLDARIRNIVSSAEIDEIVICDRFAMHYFCKEYGIKYIAAFTGCTADAEPGPKAIVKITTEVREKGIPAVFYAELSNRKTAQTVADETGAEMLLLHSCHNLSSEEFERGETYLSLMNKNADNLAVAMKSKG